MSSAAQPQQPSGPTLEIAHVLFLDVVGYSKLSMDHQHEVLSVLQGLVRETADFRRSEKRRQLIRLPTGDGMALVFFGDAEAPARCALELGAALRDRPHIGLRMGIHTGPVYRVADINANRNVAGGGINMAQRVMDCGDAGHILLSKAAADLISPVGDWATLLHDLGEAEVKHGVRIHLFNLYRENAGNAARPEKLRAAAKRKTIRKSKIISVVLGLLAAVFLAVAGGWLYHARQAQALNETDTLLLADFSNTTGEPVFDDTLRQGLAAQLEQSPFLNLISDRKIQQTLKLMRQPADAQLTPGIARDLCQRVGSKAYLSGAIAVLGRQYVLGLEAVNCQTGDTLAQLQVTADSKEHVLAALGDAATQVRTKLGESLSTVQKFDTPLQQATTSSLEALQAYSLAKRTGKTGDISLPLMQRAIQLDPDFAMAYVALGIYYDNAGDIGLAAENTRKAYELRERVSERERLYIESHYHELVTGDLEKARAAFELASQTYPRDSAPRSALSRIYTFLGLHEKALEQAQEVVRLNPSGPTGYADVALIYVNLGRLAESRAVGEQARAKNLDSPFLHYDMYEVAFLRKDAAGMAQQVSWAAGKPGVEDNMLSYEADTAGYYGQVAKAREFGLRATGIAEREGDKETVAGYQAGAALREAFFGYTARARELAAAALALSPNRDVEYGAALALALAGDSSRAQTIAQDLAQRFPQNTLVRFNYLPTIQGQLAVGRRDAAKAIEYVQQAAPYELGLGTSAFASGLNPVYVRGEAYLAARQGSAAAAEFQKILDWRGAVLNAPIGALAHLGLARAYALQGDAAKARAAYQDFFTLWKDADPDIPILHEAKTEFAHIT